MGFPKSMRRSKKRSSKGKLKGEPIGYAWPKPLSHVKRKRKIKLGETKYMGALLSKSEKTKNVRTYTFGISTKDGWPDDDSATIVTTSVSSCSSRDVEVDPTFLFAPATDFQGLNSRQIRTCASSESFSSPSLSSFTASSDDSGNSNQFEVREDATGVIIRMRESRDDTNPNPNEGLESMPPLLPPPPRYVPNSNTSNTDMNDYPQTVDTTHKDLGIQSDLNFEIRNKPLPKREIRRNASEGSRDFVHVFHQPLPPLDEDISLYSGSEDDADDELCNNDCSEHNAPGQRRATRRGSLSSLEDELDLRQRWEYGLAMMAQMGMNAVGNLNKMLDADAPVSTLRNDNEYDENNSVEI